MARRHAHWLLIGAAVLAAGNAAIGAAQERVTGRARITDGDSLEVGRTQVRLFGIDAPEGRQSCTRAGRDWACGNEAARKLASLIGGRTVSCTARDVDECGRIVAVCRSGGIDLAAEMARAGLALAYRRFSDDYLDEENDARAARRGLWAAEFTPPEDYRRGERAAAAAQRREEAPRPTGRRAACDIKGNINRGGERIYHVPGSPAYDDTAIDERRGERWFCTEAEARAAGWRPPGR